MSLVLLLVLHAALSVAGFALLWRRLDRQRLEITRLKEQLGGRVTQSARKLRSADGSVVSISELAAQRVIPAATSETRPRAAAPERKLRAPTLSPETGRALVLALMAVAPALGFFVDGGATAAVTSGLAIAAAMMVIALRQVWRVAAWASVLTAAAWAAIGFALGTALADPMSYAICLGLAGIAGIINAHVRRAARGVAMALLMAGASLALGSQIGMFSAAGAGFAVITAVAAIVGALSLRLEAIHLAAFGASVLGLFVLSGQDGAAIWFTPVAVWAGALFFAIAAVRVPQLGARGVALAGTGAFAPLGVIAALHAARHGLAEPLAAAIAFFAFAGLLCGLIALAALRRGRGLAALRLTLWVLVSGAFAGFAGAFVLALPVQLTAAAFASLALGLAAINARLPNRAWRTFAVFAGFFAGAFALLAARSLLAETVDWSPWLTTATGLAAPALLAAGAAFLFGRTSAQRNAGFFEAVALVFAIATANVAIRLAFAGGATLLQPVTFVEAAAHCSLWLAASLAVAWRVKHGARQVREAFTRGLAIMALAALLVSGVLWLASFWPHAPAGAWFARESFGFLIPAILLTAHWVFWRWRNTDKRARVAFGAAAALLAVFLILELTGFAALPMWAKTLGAGLIAALALGGNFAPGVTTSGERLRLREKSPSQSATQAAR